MTTPSDNHPIPPRKAPLPDDFMQSLRVWQVSRVLLTAIELDLFTAVGDGASGAEVARRLNADPRGVEALLNAVAGLGYLEKKDGIFHNGPLAARHLCAGAEHDQRAGLMHTATLWHRWSHLTECVRSGLPAPRDEWTPADAEEFIAAMEMNSSARAPQLVAALDLSGVRRLLDVGGGSGAYTIAFAQAAPGLTAQILDQEEVVPIAERHIRAAGLADRISLRPGDLNHDDLGTGFDLVLLSAICHMNGPAENADLINRAARALDEGGRLVIHDHILEPDRTAPLPGALFNLNMLVNTRSGGNYTAAEYFGWMQAAGLGEMKRVGLPGPTALVIGTKR